MEPVVATVGHQRQDESAGNRGTSETVAVSCDWLREAAHGKEGVEWGSKRQRNDRRYVRSAYIATKGGFMYQVRVYALRTPEALAAYEAIWSRHIPSLARHRITTHGVWTAPGARHPSCNALVSYTDGDDLQERDQAYMPLRLKVRPKDDAVAREAVTRVRRTALTRYRTSVPIRPRLRLLRPNRGDSLARAGSGQALARE